MARLTKLTVNIWIDRITVELSGHPRGKGNKALNTVHQRLPFSLSQKLCYMSAKRCEKESRHLMQNATNDFSVATFYFRPLTVKGWLKTKPNFELNILVGR